MPVRNKSFDKHGNVINRILVIYKVCEWCGDIAPVYEPKRYAYKYTAKDKTWWFCSWTCMCKAQKKNPPKSWDGRYPEPKTPYNQPIKWEGDKCQKESS